MTAVIRMRMSHRVPRVGTTGECIPRPPKLMSNTRWVQEEMKLVSANIQACKAQPDADADGDAGGVQPSLPGGAARPWGS
eukprot:CAMPEP_0175397738 /NCGR_PEP_ID=MMETSP0095-20121207/35130_1 /TAXON_ID=311494 /ORGANISM="Alexandrium monilatum, Strain CCMP3105" /LENGTH=79 /DNA_ID=CAMNT_0016696431 /DNA_START=206 /DNA_END=443 /DNA_ORIENTATION=-